MLAAKGPQKKVKYSTRKKLHAVHTHVSRHYYAYMPEKKHYRVMIWAVFFVVSGTIALQMLYPLDRALPFARYAGEIVGGQLHSDLSGRIEKDFRNKRIVLKAGDRAIESVPLAYAGVEPNTEAMVTRLDEYSFLLRMIPFSILWQWPSVESFDTSFTISKLDEFSVKHSPELSYPAINARLAIDGGVLKATQDRSGMTVRADDIKNALLAAHIAIKDTQVIMVNGSVAPAQKTSAHLAAVRADADRALVSKLSIVVDGAGEFSPTSGDIASWLVISADAHGKTTLTADMGRIESYIETLSQKVGTPAGTTNVTIVNGRETGRVEGSVGKRIAPQPLGTAIADYLLVRKGTMPLRVSLTDVAPVIVYNNKYTATQEGLQAYVNDMSARGAWISIQQVDRARWAVSARADESIPSASTYKLFVALRLFYGMDRGEIGWGDPILDTTVSHCFDRMTIASTNPCAVEWLSRFGRDNVNSFVYDRGFSHGTSFTHPEAVHTTAGDLTKFMIGLNDGTLISGAHRDRLFRSLSTHPYRYGIPTGSAASEIYDKVGFLWDYVHDTAIVHHPKGTYIMTIMTKGQSYGAIANMTREIERIMYP